MAKITFYLCLFAIACNTHSGKQQIVSSIPLNADSLVTVYYFLNTECPICKKYSGRLNHTFNKFTNTFRFYYVFPGQQSENEILAFCNYDSIPHSAIIRDIDYHISKNLGATITPQVLIYIKKKMIYSGKIDDRFESITSYKQNATINYIEKALISLQKNEAVEIKKTNPVGCFIEPD